MTARLGDDEYQGYGSIDEAAGGGFNPRASGMYATLLSSYVVLIKPPLEGRFGELQSRLSKAIFDIGRHSECCII